MRFALTLVLCLLLRPGLALADGRVALLIGNAAYANTALALRNPANDARDLAAALTRLGFTVRSEIDQSAEEMRAALSWFRGAAEGAEVALLFYAGHAVLLGSENHLIGVDLGDVSARALPEASVTLRETLDVVDGLGADLALVVLDACRNSPFTDEDIGQAGLSPVSGGLGTLVAYATDPGNVAGDGVGENSPFTAALLEHIETPGLDVRLMFGRVRQEVVRLSQGQQVPWVEEAVIGEHYLAGAPEPLAPGDELRVWREAVAARSVAGYQGYLDQFPNGIYAIVADLRIDTLQGAAPESADLIEADLAGAEAALELLGYMVPGVSDAEPGVIRQAFARWQGAQPAGGQRVETLMREAARTATFLGTYTAGLLKNDLQRFASVEEAYQNASEALATAEAEFGGDPARQQALETMRGQVAQIASLRAGVAGDLDASRTYYSDLVRVTERYLTEWISPEMQPRFASSRGITRLSDRAITDAQTFFAHVTEAGAAPEGSYGWLASMMEGF